MNLRAVSYCSYNSFVVIYVSVDAVVLAALTALRAASITCSAVSVRYWGLDFDYKLSLICV